MAAITPAQHKSKNRFAEPPGCSANRLALLFLTGSSAGLTSTTPNTSLLPQGAQGVLTGSVHRAVPCRAFLHWLLSVLASLFQLPNYIGFSDCGVIIAYKL
jgi:hypothetical protein